MPRRPAAFIDELLTRVVQAGIPLWRVYIGLQLVHPQLQRHGLHVAARREVQEVARAYGIQFTPAYIGSPIQEVREQGRAVRYRSNDSDPSSIMRCCTR